MLKKRHAKRVFTLPEATLSGYGRLKSKKSREFDFGAHHAKRSGMREKTVLLRSLPKGQEPGFRIEVPPDLAPAFGLSVTPATSCVIICQRPVQVRPAYRRAA